ncbi:hypothetical protein [Streptomyces showdoensis]|nr:hypothetical protein [Streptomyces showdoensis]
MTASASPAPRFPLSRVTSMLPQPPGRRTATGATGTTRETARGRRTQLSA